jgi:hypothetical protein
MNVNENFSINVNFSGLEEIYSGSPKDLVLILKKIQQEYIKYNELFKEQIQAENMEEFRKARHKISATLLLLKLEGFHEYLTFLKEHFSKGFYNKNEAIENLQKSFSKVQEILLQKLEQMGQ